MTALSASPKKLRNVSLAVIIAIGVLRVWIGRYTLCPDGISYLDLSDAFASHRWLEAINSYWSPLYPWMLSWVVPPVTSAKWQVPAAQMANILIYVLALGCFEFFLQAISERSRSLEGQQGSTQLPQSPLRGVAYALFLWSSLDLIGVADVSPDLLVAAVVYGIAGLMVRVRTRATISIFAALGLALGIGYWAKAIMFPLGVIFLTIARFAVPRNRQRFSKIGVSAVIFIIVAAPLVAVLSYKTGRLTFGDSGWLNYAASVSPGGGVRNWQGIPSESGVPVHPTRLIVEYPPVYEFAAPIGGTYPPTYDPAYWNAGHRWTWNARAQARVIARHAMTYAGLLISQSGLLAGTLALLAVGGSSTLEAIAGHWPLLVMCFVPFGVYALVHAETRFLGAYVAIAWIVVLSSVRLPPHLANRMVPALLWAVAATMVISVIASTARAWRDSNDPCSVRPQVAVAEELERNGVTAGAKVASFGDGDWAYWARLAHLRIVAEIMTPDLPEFWKANAGRRQAVYDALAAAGSTIVVAQPPEFVPLDEGWSRLGGTSYYVRQLRPEEIHE
jgi:hypothetical protein